VSTHRTVIKHKVGLLRLAQELGNVSRASKVMGYSRDTVPPVTSGTEPARAACHPKDRSGAKEVRSTLTRREQRLLLCLTYAHEFQKTPP